MPIGIDPIFSSPVLTPYHRVESEFHSSVLSRPVASVCLAAHRSWRIESLSWFSIVAALNGYGGNPPVTIGTSLR